jgi:hypothetical protein
MIQAASDAGNAAGWCSSSSTFCISTATMSAPGRAQGAARRLAGERADAAPPLHYSDYHRAQGVRLSMSRPESWRSHRLETRRRLNGPGNRGLWRKVTAPRGICNRRLDRSGRHAAVAWRFAPRYYDPHGKLVYVARPSTGIKQAELERLAFPDRGGNFPARRFKFPAKPQKIPCSDV